MEITKSYIVKGIMHMRPYINVVQECQRIEEESKRGVKITIKGLSKTIKGTSILSLVM